MTEQPTDQHNLLRFAQWLHDAGYLAEPYSEDDLLSDAPQALVDRFLGVDRG